MHALDCVNPGRYIGHGTDPYVPYVADPANLDPNSIVVVTAQAGNWESGSTWLGGTVPGPSSVVVIKHAVVLNSQTRVLDAAVLQSGKLSFNPSANTRLELRTAQMCGGEWQMGTAGVPIADDKKAEIVFLDSALDLTKDPGQYTHGMFGIDAKITMHGSVRTPAFVRLANEGKKGNSTLVLESGATGWKTGDRVVLPDSHQLQQFERYNGFKIQSEELSASGVSPDGRTITFSPSLQYDHPGARNSAGVLEFLPHAMNLTRNVISSLGKPRWNTRSRDVHAPVGCGYPIYGFRGFGSHQSASMG